MRRRMIALREDAGLTRQELAHTLGVNPKTVQRWETGEHAPLMSQRIDLARVLDEHTAGRTVTLADVHRAIDDDDNGPINGHRVTRRLGMLVGLEQGAGELWTFETTVMPGLLQTPEYATAVERIAADRPSAKEVARRVALRMRRQHVLHSLTLRAVVDASVLWRTTGGPHVMAAQLDTSDGFGNADLSITTPVFGGGVLSPDVMDDVDRVPEIDQAVGVARATVVIDGEETQVAATDMAGAAGATGAADILDVAVREGSLDDVGPGEVVISETRAEDEGWTVGSTIDVTYLDDSTEQMTVGAVIDDNDVLAGIVIPTEAWFDRAPQPSYTSVFMTLAGGVDLDQGRAAITDIANRYTGDVQDRAEFSDAANAGLDMLLGLVYAMLAFAILISLLGIANTLSMAVHERRHEIGLLRAVGQTRRQTRSVLRLESAIVATFGTTLGLLVGAALGSVLYTAIAEGDGSVVVPWTSLLVILLAGMAAGVLAARRPARRAARVDILDAINTT